MVGVAVGDHHKIEFGEVDAQRLHVVLKNRGIVPGVEQDPLAVVLDERGKSPVLGQLLRFAEGIVENGHFILGPAGHGSQTQQHQQNRDNPQDVDSHGMPPA